MEQRNVFTTRDAFRYLKLSRQGVYDRLSDLVKGGWIVRLRQGTYFISPFETGKEGGVTEHDFVIASYLVSPHAIGLWSALNQHGLTEQIPDRVYVLSTRRISKPTKKIGASTYQIIVIPKKRFFGTQEIWFGSKKAVITDLEKTLLDAFLFPQYCGGMIEVVKSFKNAISKINFSKLTHYANRIGKGVLFKRLGILMDQLKPDFKEKKIWLKQISKGISLFDPQGEPSGPIVSEWNIRVNFNLEASRS
ncbi:MAG: hypothetical protein A3G87_04370 [Omnitrophica bacterium RIFCSPLOWO2_12_FULL_50_11]|nr:MAG: hypothetical protein A3G87_04370 [Omnitrophica bacterium RIFCSPLOWO2_12_FULL_50_11]